MRSITKPCKVPAKEIGRVEVVEMEMMEYGNTIGGIDVEILNA